MEGGLLGLINAQQQSAQAAKFADSLLLTKKQECATQPQQQRKSDSTTETTFDRSDGNGKDQVVRLPHVHHHHGDQSRRASWRSAAPAFLDFKGASQGAAQSTQTPDAPPATIFDDLRCARMQYQSAAGSLPTGTGTWDMHQHQTPEQQPPERQPPGQQPRGEDEAALLQALARLLAPTTQQIKHQVG